MTNSYESPFCTRYASKEMQFVFSADKKFTTWRRLWVALARAEMKLGLNVTQAQVDERLKDFERLAGGEIFGQKKLIRNLSAGNKQKVGIISALFNRPKLVILDEPFNFLDPSSQNTLKHVLTDYNKQTGATILVSSHNLAHTIDISTRIALLEKGHIVRDLPNADGNAKAELENYFETE
jgi:ABC-2 type transport system ATP-binding protein